MNTSFSSRSFCQFLEHGVQKATIRDLDYGLTSIEQLDLFAIYPSSSVLLFVVNYPSSSTIFMFRRVRSVVVYIFCSSVKQARHQAIILCEDGRAFSSSSITSSIAETSLTLSKLCCSESEDDQ